MATASSLTAPETRRRSSAFMIVYALANAGGVIAYLPLLTLLLPIKVEAIAGGDRFGVLTATIVTGAIAASASNIVFGWLSDRALVRGGGRRPWVATGTIATAVSYIAVALAGSITAIIVAVALFQVAINLLLAPLLAIMADEIPDEQKGVAGGLLALANPIASGLSALLLGLTGLHEGGQLTVIAAATFGCAAPLLLTRSQRLPRAPLRLAAPVMQRRDLSCIWAARFLMQVAGNVLGFYVLYYFESLGRSVHEPALPARVGHLLAVAYALPLPIAVVAGRWSDRLARRKPFLLLAALFAASGLGVMAVASGWSAGAAGFILYAIGSAVFLTLHSSLATQLLPDPAHHGRDLGMLNLANTLPALAGPTLAWWLATSVDFSALMLMLSGITLAGGGTVLAVRGRR